MADEFDLSELIAAPIRALNEAEAAAASRFVELFLEYTLEAAPDGMATRQVRTAADAPGTAAQAPPLPRLRQLSFEMHRADPDGQIRAHTLTVPLLQLLPFGGVSIDQATLHYGLALRVGAASTAEGQGAAPASRFTGRLAQTRGGAATAGTPSDANLDIEVKLRQMDMPQGLLDLIQHTQGVVRSEASEPVTVQEPAALPFQVDILGIARDLRAKAPTVRITVRVTPQSGLDGPLALRFTETPAGSFKLAVAKGSTTITAPKQFELTLTGFSAEQLARLAAGRLGVTIGGSGIARDGEAVDHTVLVMIAPQHLGEV